MAAKKHIDVLDPFGDNEAEYKTTEIRHSRARDSKTPFINRAPEPKKRSPLPLLIALVSVAVLAILAIIFIPKLSHQTPPEAVTPLINPTGRGASSEYTDNLEDPELRASEEEKLNTVISLIAREDWEYANAFFETIFPAYLDSCGKYDYYRAAASLYENFPDFPISPETSSARMKQLSTECHR